MAPGYLVGLVVYITCGALLEGSAREAVTEHILTTEKAMQKTPVGHSEI